MKIKRWNDRTVEHLKNRGQKLCPLSGGEFGEDSNHNMIGIIKLIVSEFSKISERKIKTSFFLERGKSERYIRSRTPFR